MENDELNSLYTQITNMGKELQVKDNEISRLRARLEKYEPKVTDDTESTENSEKKTSAKKADAKSKEVVKPKSAPKKVEAKPKEPAKPKPATKKAKSK